MPVLLQDAVGVAGPEVLPVQHRLGEQPGGGLDEGVDELVVTLPANPGVPLAEVEVAVEQAEVVGADVEDDRHDPARVDPGRRGVDRELADGDLDATDALVADPEDALGVGGDDEVDIAGGQAVVEQRLLDVLRAVDRDEHPTGTVVFDGEPLDDLADRGRVDDGKHLFDVVGEQPVEEHLVAVAEAGEVVVLGERGPGRVVLLVDPAHLVADGGHLTGHEADQAEVAPLLDGEGRPAVGHGVGQHRAPAGRDAQRRVAAGRVQLVVAVHHARL